MATCDNHPGVEAEHVTCRFCLEEEDLYAAKVRADLAAMQARAEVAERERDVARARLTSVVDAATAWGLELDRRGLAGVVSGSVTAGGRPYVEATAALARAILRAAEAEAMRGGEGRT